MDPKLTTLMRYAQICEPMCPACLLEMMLKDVSCAELPLSYAFKLRWVRMRDALYQHGERHFVGDAEWWDMFNVFEMVATRVVR